MSTEVFSPVFRDLVEKAGDIITVFSENGTILYENAAVERILGYKPEERLGDFGFASVHPDDRTRLLTMFASSVSDPLEIRRAVVRVRHKSGAWVRLESIANGLPAKTGFVVLSRDITERVSGIVSNEDAAAGFRAALDAVETPLVAHRNGLILHTNPAFATTLGYAEGSLNSRRMREILHADDQDACMSMNPEPARLISGSGREVALECSSLPVFFDGAPAMITTCRAVSQRLTDAGLVLADRMSSVGTLAGGVAHEINNPLAYVLANINFCLEELSDLAKSDGTRFGELHEALEEALQGGERVRRIVHDLKMFSQGSDLAVTDLDVADVLESAINMARNEIRHRATLHVHTPENPLSLEGNSARIGQLFLNVLLNAAQAIPEGAAAQNEIHVRMRNDQRHVVIEVSDTGCGIPMEIHERIFDPFFTAWQDGPSTGLGLSVCHGIVAGMDGRIELESEVGKGSVFRVILPKTQATATVPAGGNRARILVIDDEELIGRAVQRTLHEHAVTVMTSARDALALLTGTEHYDLIICDLLMPDVTGMEVYSELLRAAPHHLDRIVFLTGGAFTPRAKAFLAGVPNPHLDKPFETAQLRSTVRELLAGF